MSAFRSTIDASSSARPNEPENEVQDPRRELRLRENSALERKRCELE
jgi:hypothetical protein